MLTVIAGEDWKILLAYGGTMLEVIKGKSQHTGVCTHKRIICLKAVEDGKLYGRLNGSSQIAYIPGVSKYLIAFGKRVFTEVIILRILKYLCVL